ncbi:hypothetical protein [Bifidobacterium sp. ESL0790]|uniref:hypothetical protein n=1 Tax=Bifidobacterium sp. ESL0790 TaxID=2983233 RepID=UPI0023F6F245|nr:hypothetical protein [Bifidobacterium sp. ESL0790]WEV72618.1 hypothetical protein OZY47_01110 [Bifidobacterium sp. ESL0790]
MAASGDGKRHSIGQAFGVVGNNVYVLLMAGWCIFIGISPLIVMWLVVHDISYYPSLTLALALSSPGIAAAFALFRDQPTLFGRAGKRKVQMVDHGYKLPDWIAGPYVGSDQTAACIRPYFRAYVRLFPRAILQGAIYGFFIFSFSYSMQIMMQINLGAMMVPILSVCILFLIQALLVSLILIVEYPYAKWYAVVKNGVLLSVRRLYMIVVDAVAVIGYFWGMASYPILTGLMFTGIIWYIIWASARWQADVLFEALARQSGDEKLVELYTGDSEKHRGGRGGGSGMSGLFSAMSDYQQ